MGHRKRLTKFSQHFFIFKNAVHYEISNLTVGTEISADIKTDTCPILSAEHYKHEYDRLRILRNPDTVWVSKLSAT